MSWTSRSASKLRSPGLDGHPDMPPSPAQPVLCDDPQPLFPLPHPSAVAKQDQYAQ